MVVVARRTPVIVTVLLSSIIRPVYAPVRSPMRSPVRTPVRTPVPFSVCAVPPLRLSHLHLELHHLLLLQVRLVLLHRQPVGRRRLLGVGGYTTRRQSRDVYALGRFCRRVHYR